MHDNTLHFDGAYRTSSPIILDAYFGKTLSLLLQFRRNSMVDHEFRLDENSCDEEVESGTSPYEWTDYNKVRFSFDAGWWETEWEGTPSERQLDLSFRMEVYGGGPAAPLKCVSEGDATLWFTPAKPQLQTRRIR